MKLCALHYIEEPLQASHIIPKLFYRHLKRDAGNHPFYNIGSKQLQDGYKIPLLCHDAEEQFSKYEDYFARYIFRPLLSNDIIQVEYDQTLLKFNVSLIWRAMLDFKMTVECNKTITPANSMAFTKPILDNWKEYLLENTPKPNGHFYIFPISEKWLDDNNIPGKYHRCFLCDMDWSFHCINDYVLFYVVAPGFLFIVDLFSDDDAPLLFNDHNINEYRGILSKDILLNNNLQELLTFIGEKGLKAIDKVFPNKEKVLKDLESSKEYIGSNVRRIYMKALKK